MGVIYYNDNGPHNGEIFDRRSELERVNNSLENIGNIDSWLNTGWGGATLNQLPAEMTMVPAPKDATRVAALVREPGASETGRISASLLTIMDVMSGPRTCSYVTRLRPQRVS